MMKTRRLASLAAAALVATGIAGGIANAAGRERGQDAADATALAGLRITLSQAIATAETQTGGRAVSADVSRERGATARIEVEVAGPQGARTVLVDGQTGAVTAVHDAGAEGDED